MPLFNVDGFQTFAVSSSSLWRTPTTRLYATNVTMTNDEHDMWDEFNIEYENAYRNNPFERDGVEKAIALLKPGSNVLDFGCGTGMPVARMLVDAGMDVHGADVATEMIDHAKASVKETFEVVNMVDHKPQGTFYAVFIIFSQLALTYAAIYGAVQRLAQTLRPDGLLVIGQAPAEQVVPLQDDAWDATQSYVEGYNLPFLGQPFPTLMFSRFGQKKSLE